MPLLRTVPALETLRESPRRLLAVFAHPDDESYGCAGAFARAGADPAAAAVLLCLTRGEASSMGAQLGLAPAAVGDLREERLVRVAEVVHLDGLVVADLPDSRLARVSLPDADAPIRAVLEAFRPQVVITHDARGVNGHPDHIAAHWAVRRALAGAEDVRLAMVAYTQETSEVARPRLLFPTAEDEIDATLRLSEAEVAAKEACLQVHKALVTLRAGGDPSLLYRPPIEHFDLLGEALDPAVADLFERLPG